MAQLILVRGGACGGMEEEEEEEERGGHCASIEICLWVLDLQVPGLDYFHTEQASKRNKPR